MFLCPWNSPGKNTGVDCMPSSKGYSWSRDRTFVSRIGRQILYQLSNQRSPWPTLSSLPFPTHTTCCAPLHWVPPSLLWGANSYSSFKAQVQTPLPCTVVVLYLSFPISLPISSPDCQPLEASNPILVISATPKPTPHTKWAHRECLTDKGGWVTIQCEYRDQWIVQCSWNLVFGTYLRNYTIFLTWSSLPGLWRGQGTGFTSIL